MLNDFRGSYKCPKWLRIWPSLLVWGPAVFAYGAWFSQTLYWTPTNTRYIKIKNKLKWTQGKTSPTTNKQNGLSKIKLIWFIALWNLDFFYYYYSKQTENYFIIPSWFGLVWLGFFLYCCILLLFVLVLLLFLGELFPLNSKSYHNCWLEGLHVSLLQFLPSVLLGLGMGQKLRHRSTEMEELDSRGGNCCRKATNLFTMHCIISLCQHHFSQVQSRPYWDSSPGAALYYPKLFNST